MVNPTTPNIVLEQPLRGSEVGTWDTPVNSNTGIIDNAFGGVTSIALSSNDVTLASSQAQAAILRLTGNLNGFVTINLPSIYKGWIIDNQLTNSLSSFAARIASSGATSIIGVPPGSNDIFYDGTNVKYRNLGRIGEYWDYAGGSVPTWVAQCTIPPYLNCTGAVFSSATYPILANLLGTTTLPDLRGRTRAYLNQGSSRMLSSTGGVDGNTIFSGGGLDTHTLNSGEMPQHSHAVTDPGHLHTTFVGRDATAGGASANSMNGTSNGNGGTPTGSAAGTTFNVSSGVTNITIQNTGGGNPHSIMQPTTVGGITMIRSA